MAVRKTSDITKVGHDILTTAMGSNGLITAQTGDVVTGEATANDSELYSAVGVVGRPRKPDAGSKAAQIVAITRGDHDAIIGIRDERVIDIYNSLDDGETVVFASAKGGGFAIFKKDGSITLQNGAGSMVVAISADGVAIGGPTPAALAFGATVQQFMLAVQTFATSTEADPLLPILLPATYSAIQALVAAMLILVSTFVEEGQTQNLTAT